MKRAFISFVLAMSVAACGHRDDRGEVGATARHIEIELKRQGVDGVEVDIRDGTATLRGLVPTASQRVLAETVARQSARPPVTRVLNEVQIARPPVLTSAADESRAAGQIESRVRSLGIEGVRIEVERGAFIVRGEIRLGNHDDVMRIAAQEAPPGYHVVDRTTVR